MSILKFFKDLIAGENPRTPEDQEILEELRKLNNGQSCLSQEQLQELDRELRPVIESGDPEEGCNLAHQKMREEDYHAAIYLFRKLAKNFPTQRQECESQIGTAFYCLGKYNKAIESYIAARVHGADTQCMDENIWEACQTLYKEAEDPVKQREPMNLYLTLCPKGSHQHHARQLIEGASASQKS
jgi:tetratricopeptide (TPR) repeat protein